MRARFGVGLPQIRKRKAGMADNAGLPACGVPYASPWPALGAASLLLHTYRPKEKRLAALLKFAARPRGGEEAGQECDAHQRLKTLKVHGCDCLPHAEGLAPVRLSGSCAHPRH